MERRKDFITPDKEEYRNLILQTGNRKNPLKIELKYKSFHPEKDNFYSDGMESIDEDGDGLI